MAFKKLQMLKMLEAKYELIKNNNSKKLIYNEKKRLYILEIEGWVTIVPIFVLRPVSY